MSNLLERLYFEGCDVYAHDHTVKNFPSTKQLNLHLAKIGIGVSNNMTYKGQIKTLETILQENGHLDRIISYLKAGNMSQLDLIYWICFIPKTKHFTDWCGRKWEGYHAAVVQEVTSFQNHLRMWLANWIIFAFQWGPLQCSSNGYWIP